MNFTADQVWGLAVAADRINGGYLKETEWLPNATPPCRGREANKVMVKQWLRDGAFSEATVEDIEKGREYRAYFNTFTMKLLTGKINDFEKQALKISQMDEFTGRNLLEFAVISCLPSVARRDQERTALTREIYNSEQLVGDEGEVVIGSITVVNCYYNQNYNKFKVNARMGDSFVHFWYKDKIEGDLRVKGKIKAVRGDKTTALNYVKIIG